MRITIGIPTYHAQIYLKDLLNSLALQTIADNLDIIIASDEPTETQIYKQIANQFNLNINVLDTEKNTGSGLARQRCIEACKTDWIIFADADDVFYTPFALETLIEEIEPQYVLIQGGFMEELNDKTYCNHFIHQNPWVFAKLYYVPFLQENNIKFSNLQIMEDGEFNWKVYLFAGDAVKRVPQTVYLWKYNPNSISHNLDYKYNKGQFGTIQAAMNTIKFYLNRFSYDNRIIDFIVYYLIEFYFSYIEISSLYPQYLDAIVKQYKEYYKFYYSPIENYIQKENIIENYLKINYEFAYERIPIIPEITLFQFIDMLKNN